MGLLLGWPGQAREDLKLVGVEPIPPGLGQHLVLGRPNLARIPDRFRDLDLSPRPADLDVSLADLVGLVADLVPLPGPGFDPVRLLGRLAGQLLRVVSICPRVPWRF